MIGTDSCRKNEELVHYFFYYTFLHKMLLNLNPRSEYFIFTNDATTAASRPQGN